MSGEEEEQDLFEGLDLDIDPVEADPEPEAVKSAQVEPAAPEAAPVDEGQAITEEVFGPLPPPVPDPDFIPKPKRKYVRKSAAPKKKPPTKAGVKAAMDARKAAAPVPKSKVHLVHLVEDGLTALGQVWYRGQEIEVTEGSEQWQKSLDRNGQSWLDYDTRAQYKQFGQEYFRPGPWPGEPWVASAPSDADPSEVAQLQRLDEARDRGLAVQ